MRRPPARDAVDGAGAAAEHEVAGPARARAARRHRRRPARTRPRAPAQRREPLDDHRAPRRRGRAARGRRTSRTAPPGRRLASAVRELAAELPRAPRHVRLEVDDQARAGALAGRRRASRRARPDGARSRRPRGCRRARRPARNAGPRRGTSRARRTPRSAGAEPSRTRAAAHAFAALWAPGHRSLDRPGPRDGRNATPSGLARRRARAAPPPARAPNARRARRRELDAVARDQQAVGRQPRRPGREQLDHVAERGVVVEMVEVDVQHDRDVGRQPRDGAVGLVALGDADVAAARGGVAAELPTSPPTRKVGGAEPVSAYASIAVVVVLPWAPVTTTRRRCAARISASTSERCRSGRPSSRRATSSGSAGSIALEATTGRRRPPGARVVRRGTRDAELAQPVERGAVGAVAADDGGAARRAGRGRGRSCRCRRCRRSASSRRVPASASTSFATSTAASGRARPRIAAAIAAPARLARSAPPTSASRGASSSASAITRGAGGEVRRVHRLVVVRRARPRDQDRRAARRRDLEDPAARAARDEVGAGEQARHRVAVLEHA